MNSSNFSFHIGNGFFVGQTVDLSGGLFLLVIGTAIIDTLATWRFRGMHVDGEIIGVRRRGPRFHGVYRYLLPMVLAVVYMGRWLWSRAMALPAKLQPGAMPDPGSALPIEPAEFLGATSPWTAAVTSKTSKCVAAARSSTRCL